MNNQIYEKNSQLFLIARDKYRLLKRNGKLNRKQISELKKRFRVMSYWLLLKNPNHKEKTIQQHRAFLFLKNWELNS